MLYSIPFPNLSDYKAILLYSIYHTIIQPFFLVCSPFLFHHFTIYNRNHRTHRRCGNPRPHDRRRIHAPVLAPVRLGQAKTKNLFYFLHLPLFFITSRKIISKYTYILSLSYENSPFLLFPSHLHLRNIEIFLLHLL